MERAIYKIETIEGVTIFKLMLDSITMDETQGLAKSYIDMLANGTIKNVILDLSETDFIPSMVISALVVMFKKTREAGSNVVICGVCDSIKKVFDMTHLDRVFEIFDDRKKAISKLTGK